VIGDSHAYTLVAFPRQLSHYFKNGIHMQAMWPGDVPKHIDHRDHPCDIQIIQIGQWPASFMAGPKAYSVQQYADEMASVLVKHRNRTDLLVLNVHYAPLSARATSCPPSDWRSPELIDAYNRALKKVCNEYNIQFVDTNSVMFTLWDSGEDFCHYRAKVGHWEAAFLARLINEKLQVHGAAGGALQHAGKHLKKHSKKHTRLRDLLFGA
jgi:hypothetical protein